MIIWTEPNQWMVVKDLNGDALSNYLYIQTNADDSVTVYLPDNAQARTMIAGYTGGESIQNRNFNREREAVA